MSPIVWPLYNVYVYLMTDAQHVDQLPDSTHDMQKQQIMMMTQPPAAEAVPYHSYTTRDSAGNMVTELTILHNMSLSETPPQHTIVLQGDVLRNPAGDGLRHPVNPQEVTTETEVVPMPPQEYPDSTQNSECAAFVEATRNALTPILAKFETIFTGNPEVIQFTVCLLGGIEVNLNSVFSFQTVIWWFLQILAVLVL